MWQWMHQNAAVLSFFANVGTLLVWVFYAHLLYSGFVRQRKARIVINQGWGKQIDSVCLIANMSQEPIYFHSILLTIRTHNGEYTESITDFDSTQLDDSVDNPQQITHQGPLSAGQQINLGTFRRLIRQTAEQNSDLTHDDRKPIHTLEVKNFKITVIASYGPEGGIVGAQRKFIVRGDNNQLMQPAGTDTQRMAKRRARRRLQTWLEQQL